MTTKKRTPCKPRPAPSASSSLLVTIEPALYWEFRARQRDLEVAQLEAKIEIKEKARNLDRALRAIEEVHDEVSFTDLEYSWNDDTTSLTQKGATT